jgi:hypothetical protein
MSELDEQLRLLIQQYGIVEVRRRLSAIMRPLGRVRVKVSARDFVTKMSAPNSQKERLLTLAQLFEEKRFLPATADIRNLFEAYGGALPKVKARQSAIPVVFRFLSSMSDDRLDRIINEGSFGGPSELGPIADAIKATSGSLRQGGETASSSSGQEGDLESSQQRRKANT